MVYFRAPYRFAFANGAGAGVKVEIVGRGHIRFHPSCHAADIGSPFRRADLMDSQIGSGEPRRQMPARMRVETVRKRRERD